ncbi:MAG: iron ABC transporter permease, partial [Klebsiella michiganensis]|nr:iron ABC transporter permease [Klebsiella michiganensis]
SFALGKKAQRLPERRRPAFPMIALAVLFSLLALLPPGFVIAVGVDTGWETIQALVFRPRVAELLSNTLWLIALTVPLCIALGVGLAWLTERTLLAGRRLWSVLAVAPLAIPAFVQSYAWVSAVPAMHGLSAGVFLSLLAYYPFIYMPVAAVLRRLDPTLEDVAASLGTPPWRIFFRVVLPQLRLAICGGALLVALHLTFSGPAANMLAGVLALCCLAILLLEGASRGKARYARIGSGAAREQQRQPLGRLAAIPFQLALLTLVMLALGVPLMVLCRWLWLGGVENWLNADLWLSLRQTLLLGAVGALLTTACAIPIAWLGVRYPQRLIRLLEGCNYMTSSLPGIVTALALVTVTIHYARPIYQTEFTLLLAWLLMFMPRALVNLRAGIAQAPVELENVARSLGRSPGRALWSVTMRLAAPGAAAAAALVFLGITNELTATLLLSPLGTRTLSTGFWALTSEIDYVAAAPYAMLMILLSLPLTGILYIQSKKIAGL